MKYRIIIDKQAEKDIKTILKSGDIGSIKKLKQILDELEETPREGTGHPEKLKYQNNNIWSRRINKKDRFTYEIIDDDLNIILIQALGHYSDK